jgi:serine protease Do
MKKLLITLTLVLTVSLAGCYLPEDTDGDLLTEAELDGLIATAVEEAVAEYQETDLNNLSEAELLVLIEQLIPEATVETTYDLASFEQAINSMIEEIKTGVVGVVASNDDTAGSGSGVIYKKDGSDYYLVTNQHVVEDSTSLTIVYKKNGFQKYITEDVILLGEDPSTDIAVIMFTSDEDFAVVPFADSYDIELGDIVFAIGNPLGFEYYGTVTMGIISGLSRYVKDELTQEEIDAGVIGFDATLLQHDAAISPGNSGGALLNTNGELIGINNMKIVDDDVTSIGFAIPSNTVWRIAIDLEDDGELSTPYLGISTYAEINPCGMDYGVCVTVQPGLPAALAGLQDDDLITGYLNDGETEYLEIVNFDNLREAILNSSIGETISIQFERVVLGNRITDTVEIVLIEKP